jgi:demethylmenaquinone methyltransferase / 2-methoxy-6-polyprenyl-1,4-benzoquinol methylase
MNTEIQSMFEDIAPRYDLANDVLSLGIHRLWRKTAIKLSGLKSGENVLDLCTGTGDFAICSNKTTEGKCSIVGVDFSPQMLRLARQKSARFPNITFLQGDAMQPPVNDNDFDLVTIGFGIRNVSDPRACLKTILNKLKKGGRVVILEFGENKVPLFSEFYKFYSKYLMPVIGGFLTGNRKAYEYLPKSSQIFPAKEDFTKMMDDCGFKNTSYKSLWGGIAYIYLGYKK